MRLIDGDALIAQMKADAEQMEDPIAKMFTYAAINDVKHAPTIEPEQKTGKWIPLQLSMKHPPYQCTCCFRNAPMVETGWDDHIEALLTDYCPHCGAKMENNGGEPG